MTSKRLLVLAAVVALMVSAVATTAASAKADKVELCHNGHTISVSVNAEPAHLALGDTVGACNAIAPLVFTGSTLAASPGQSVTWDVSGFASGGTPSYTFASPSGVFTVSASGVISGATYVTGTYVIAVTVTDSGSPAQSATATFTITVASSGPGGAY